jgi:hypothetical protein
MRRRTFLLTPLSLLTWRISRAAELTVPGKPKSVRFAVIGDSGTGEREQFDLAQEMARVHDKFPFEFVVMLGDNIYGGQSSSDFKRKFEDPYRALLDGNIKFYASLGNHDNPNQRFYKPFNMGGQRYYSVKQGKAEFFALDSNYMDPKQLDWIKTNLENSGAQWKICFFHHPLYSNAKFHGADRDLRAQLQPLFERYSVNLVLSGHEHVYERLKPHNGISYIVLGNSGQLRYHDLRRSGDTANGFDTDQSFMIVEIADDQLYFQTISRTSKTVDSGTLELPVKASTASGSQ